MQVQSPSWEDPLQKEMAPRSSILAWEIPWTEEPGTLQSTGSQKVRPDLVTKQQQHHSLVCRYRIFFIHSSIDRLLGYFHVLAIVNSAAMNTGFLYLLNYGFLRVYAQ